MGVIATRTGEYLLVEVELPGRAPETAGVILYDAESGRLDFRFRRDWDQLSDDEDVVEVLALLEGELAARSQELGAAGFLEQLEESLSNTVRLSERRPVLLGDFHATLNRLYNQHVRAVVLPYRTHLPLVSLRAAAGGWSEQQVVEASTADVEHWVETPEDLRLTTDMFVARVTGRSMEPLIPDGSLCVFRRGVVGTREGRKVLVENLAESEAGGQRYTVKVYRSEKRYGEDGAWEHTRVWFEPLNPEFEAWDISEEHSCRVLGEFVRVLETPGGE